MTISEHRGFSELRRTKIFLTKSISDSHSMSPLTKMYLQKNKNKKGKKNRKIQTGRHSQRRILFAFHSQQQRTNLKKLRREMKEEEQIIWNRSV